MKSVPDRNKLRQDYVWRKTRAQGKVVLGATLGIAMTLAIVALMLGLCLFLMFLPLWDEPPELPPTLVLSFFGVAFGATIPFAFLAWKGGKLVKKGMAESKNLSYVPPVTADMLAAEEVLVRGSEEPTAQQKEILLRAATGQETPAEELLRVSQE